MHFFVLIVEVVGADWREGLETSWSTSLPTGGGLDRPVSHLSERESHGGESGTQVLGQDLLVVESDDRHVRRDLQPGLLDGVVGTHGDAVGRAEDRRRRLRQGQKFTHRVEAVMCVRGPLVNQDIVGLEPGLPQCCLIPRSPPDRGDPVRLQVDHGDAAMPCGEQVLDGLLAARLLVRNDRRHDFVVVDAVDQDLR